MASQTSPSTAHRGLIVQQLTKRFDHLIALNNVSFSIKPGKALGILGSNGAGKTTLINILTTVFLPDSGTASVNGFDIHTNPMGIREHLGVVSQNDRFDTYLTLWENLSLHAELHGIPKRQFTPRIEMLLEQVSLQDKRHSYMEQLSGGMKRKASLIRALIHQPEILFLDEPTTGLDPLARKQVWDAITAFKTDKTIVLTSHYMKEADELCDELVLMDKGKVLMDGNPAQLKQRVADEQGEFIYTLELNTPITTEEFSYLQSGFPASRYPAKLQLHHGQTLSIHWKKQPPDTAHWMGQLLSLIPVHVGVQSFSRQLPDLESVFFSAISSPRALLDDLHRNETGERSTLF